jgi:hypothetical protein
LWLPEECGWIAPQDQWTVQAQFRSQIGFTKNAKLIAQLNHLGFIEARFTE